MSLPPWAYFCSDYFALTRVPRSISSRILSKKFLCLPYDTICLCIYTIAPLLSKRLGPSALLQKDYVRARVYYAYYIAI